jgi:iron complex transport system substrate-binding protein
VRFVEGVIRVYTPESFLGTVLTDAGLDQLTLPTDRTPAFAELSAEQLTSADAEIVLFSSYGGAEDSGEAAVVAGPLWPRLSAVADGRAYAVEDDVFFTGIGLAAANLIVEDLTDRLG